MTSPTSSSSPPSQVGIKDISVEEDDTSNEVKLSAPELRNAFDDLFERVRQQRGFFDVEDEESEIVTIAQFV